MRYRSCLAFLMAAVAMLVHGTRAAGKPTPRETPAPVTCQALTETLTRPRWLALPMSRLIVSPTYSYAQKQPATPFADHALVTDLAYYVGALPVRLPAFLSWPLADERDAVTGANLDFTRGEWQVRGVEADFAGEQARLTPQKDYGSIDHVVTVDLDRTPNIVLQVPAVSGGWALKVNDGRQAVDTPLIADTSVTGEFAADVAAATGWHGTKTFTVRLFATGGPTKSATFAHVRFFGLTGRGTAAPRRYRWDPHQMVTRGGMGDGGLQVEATTALADEATVAQRLRVTVAGAGRLRLTGQFREGVIHWDEAHHALLLQGKQFHAVLAFSRPARWLGVRTSSVSWLTAAGESRPDGAAGGVWGLEWEGLTEGDEIIVAARFAPTLGGWDASRQAASNLATSTGFAAALRKQEGLWNKRLAGVPHPGDFTPRAVDPLGVTAADVRRTYYRAWVFLLADTLPPMPENGFHYPQCACGKPSLWGEGAPQARASAQWESFLAMQALAQIDAQTAWAAYDGQLTQMGADGSINGEGLPSCHAQTAWGLYEATGDRARLKNDYPALKKLLLWKIGDPRWIYHGSTGAGQKDNEFVVHALTDIDFAVRIASALNRPDEARFWRDQRAALAANFHRWFFPAPDGPMYRIYETAGDKRSGAGEVWNLQGLTLAPDILTTPERDSLLASFQNAARAEQPFLVPRLSRFPNYEPTWKGLLRYGRIAEAAQMADAGMRDVARAGEFSEDYGVEDGRPVPGGVRPSVFGARHAIDDVLWHNGIIYDEGLPLLVGMPDAGGVENLRVQGAPVDVTFESGQVMLYGTGLAPLRPPADFRVYWVHGIPEWRGKIAPGAQVRLERR